MGLTLEVRHAFLFLFYLLRSGRAPLGEIRGEISLTPKILAKVANKLRKAKIVRKISGDIGGYELINDPTVKQVIEAVQPEQFIVSNEKWRMASGQYEEKALVSLSVNLQKTLEPILNRQLKNVLNEVVANEVAAFK